MDSLHSPVNVGTVAATLAAATLFAGFAPAQQFVQSNAFVAPNANWTEGVECADIDNDGDLDIFFAEGDGFSSAGPKRQNKLWLNRVVPTGVLTLVDVSVPRLGSNLSNAKGVTTADIDGDGFIDVLFANGFNTDPPFLYHNQSGNPGFFDLESASRGFTEALSSASAQFGDIDDDGDLDLLLNDSGNSFLGAPGGLPRLYENDGNGFFTEIPGNLNTIAKQAHMDVQFVDIDEDWDLDFFGCNRGANGGVNHYLLLNDGTGNFSVDASSLLPTTSSNSYEAEVGDLDGDGDIDIYYISLSGFSEGAQLNQLTDTGSLGFVNGPAAGGDDDNEVCLIDYDMDGDYDAFIGSLRTTGPDKMMRNDGNGVFQLVNGVIGGGPDSTLDVTAADLDNDGRYDLITAQGESQQPWTNKIFLNTGPIDTLPPVVTRTDGGTLLQNGNVLAHATVRDQVMDDGKDWVTGRVSYVETNGLQVVDVVYDGSTFTPSVLNISSGTTVRWTNTSVIPEVLIGLTPPYNLGLLLPGSGGMGEYTFIEPVSIDYIGGFSGSGQINVTGSPTKLDALRAGVGYWRAEMPTSTGSHLCFEWQFTDWPGNLGVSPGFCVQTKAFFTYCTAKTNSLGCVPEIAGSGTPSLSDPNPFDITASMVLNVKNGLLFYGYNQAAIPFLGGTLCTTPPLRRTGLQNSGGNLPPANDCTGTYSFDMNALIQSGADPFLNPGSSAYAQFWSRDPMIGDGTGAGLTDAICLDIQP